MIKFTIKNLIALILTLTWLPIKSLAFIAPFLLVFFFFLDKKRVIFIILIALCGLLFTSDVLYPNILLSFITYGSLIVLVVVKKARFIVSEDELYSSMRLVYSVLLFESFFGIFQLFGRIIFRGEGFNFDSDVGDVIQGTIFPTSFLFEESMNGGNTMFVANLIAGTVFIMPYIVKKRKYISLFLFLLVIVLASVLHMILFWVIASAFAFLVIFKLDMKKMSILFIVFFFLFYLLYKFQPNNFELFTIYFNSTFTTDIESQTPKIASIYLSVVELPKEYPFVLLFGTGAGQFSSRAGLILTGEYLDGFKQLNQLFPNLINIPKYFIDYGYDLWNSTKNNKYGSSSISPVFSWLAFIIEFGLLGCVLFFYFLFKLVHFFSSSLKGYRDKYLVITLSFSAVSLIFFLFLIGFQDLYWEMPQAILPCIVYIILIKEFLKHTINEQKLLPNSKT